MKKRILSLTLIMAMIFTQISFISVFAETTDTTTQTPIESAFTDANFLNAVRTVIGKTNGEHIYPSDVDSITKLEVGEMDIASLAGIEYFTGLKDLNCFVNELTELDLSNNEQLEILNCSLNLNLSALNVSNNTKLKTLDCSYGKLTELNIKNNTALTKLVVDVNPLGTLDISHNTLLENLDAKNTKLTLMDMSKNPKLKKVNITQNYITEDRVILPENSSLTWGTTLKYASQRSRTSDISASFTDKNFLTQVKQAANKTTDKLTQLDVENIKELEIIPDHLTSLDGIEHLKSLETLVCSNNDLESLDLSSNRELKTVHCLDNDIISLDLSNNAVLEDVNAYNNKLEDIDISENPALKKVDISDNNLTSLDLSGSNELERVDFSRNEIEGDFAISLAADYSSDIMAQANEELKDEVDDNNAKFIVGPQVSRYIRVSATYDGGQSAILKIKAITNADFKIFDITDLKSAEGYKQGDFPGYEKDDNDDYQATIQELINNLPKEESNIYYSGGVNYFGDVTFTEARDGYKFLVVSYAPTQLDENDEPAEGTGWEIDAAQVVVIGDIPTDPILKEFKINNGYEKHNNSFGSYIYGQNGKGTVTNIMDDVNPKIEFHDRDFFVYIRLERYEAVDKVIVEMHRNDKNSKVEGKRIELTHAGNGVFTGTDHVAYGGEVYDYPERHGELQIIYTKKNDSTNKEYNLGSPIKALIIIDPSGYIYEGVPSNRLQGIKTSVYYMNRDKEAVEWDASYYDQTNPIFTDNKGSFEWYVPAGKWQVKAEMEGYETYYTDWMSVPPAQMDVNFSMVSKVQPTVTQILAYPDSIEIQFNKYMYSEDMTSDNIVVTLDGEPVQGQIAPMDEEQDYWVGERDKTKSGGSKNYYTSRVEFRPVAGMNFLQGETVNISVNKDVRTYAGVKMTEDYVGTSTVETRATGMLFYEDNGDTPMSIGDEGHTVSCGTTENIKVQITPVESSIGKKIHLVVDNDWAISVPSEITVDSEGWATIPVKAELPLSANIYMYLENSGLTNKVKINVVKE